MERIAAGCTGNGRRGSSEPGQESAEDQVQIERHGNLKTHRPVFLKLVSCGGWTDQDIIGISRYLEVGRKYRRASERKISDRPQALAGALSG